MKKSFLTFLAIVLICLNMDAQRSKKSKTKQRPSERTEQADQSGRSQRAQAPQSLNPRNTRQIAIVSDSGLKSMTGVGLSASYYATKNIAIDAGAGIGFQGLRFGARGRYLFLDKKFTPYVGAGIFRNLSSVENVEISNFDGSDTYFINLEASTYVQGIVGFEYMSDGGFVIGLHLGYSRNLNDPSWSSDLFVDDDTTVLLDFLYGSGLATGFRIGYAF